MNNLKSASQQYRAWSDCMDVQAGLALYWWYGLLTFASSRACIWSTINVKYKIQPKESIIKLHFKKSNINHYLGHCELVMGNKYRWMFDQTLTYSWLMYDLCANVSAELHTFANYCSNISQYPTCSQSQAGQKISVWSHSPDNHWQRCKINSDEQHEKPIKASEAVNETQTNAIHESIEQVKDYLNYMSKGLAKEKKIRTENTNAIERNADDIAKVVKIVNDNFVDLYQVFTQQRNDNDTCVNYLKTKLKNYEEKINSHTDNVINGLKENLIQNYTRDLTEQEKEQKEQMKNVINIIERIQSKVDLMVSTWNYQNLARGKSAKQSSTMSGGEASRATDGNSNGDWSKSSCTHTKIEMNPWWQVDLARTFIIRKIVIKNRSDCCGERLHNLVVSVKKDEESDEEICGRFKGPSSNGAKETIICNSPKTGRFLKIQIMDENSKSYLTLCEVEVFPV